MRPLSNEDRRALLWRARQAIIAAVVDQQIPDVVAPAGSLAEPGAAFVTLFCRSHLRGCVGRTDRALALAETVAQCAIGAALHDERFAPLAPHEVSELQIEVSILSTIQPILPGEIETGTHGVVVRRGHQRGLLLPRVATERGWCAERMLEETCRKAGLDLQAWRDPGTELYGFTTQTFAEGES
jgi:AmmeMemoRadiSam system protein A